MWKVSRLRPYLPLGDCRSKQRSECWLPIARRRWFVPAAISAPYEERDPLTKGLTALARGEVFAAASDTTITATYVVDMVNDVLDLLMDGETGVWHHAHPQALTWVELYREAARITGIDAMCLEAKPMAKLGLLAPRPHFCALGSERGVLSPPLDQAIGRYCADCQTGWTTLVSEERRCREAPVPKRAS